jgi:hypothetical protein
MSFTLVDEGDWAKAWPKVPLTSLWMLVPATWVHRTGDKEEQSHEGEERPGDRLGQAQP